MTVYVPATSILAGASAPALQLIEQRVTNALLIQLTNTADQDINRLRNDEAPVLGVTVPVPSA